MSDKKSGANCGGVKLCHWQREDEDSSLYHTECGRSWEFIEDGIKENRVKYCFNCGGLVVEDESEV
jgi:hypothetical protein